MVEEKKIYKSFHDISPRDYMYFPKGSIEMGKPGKFSKIEIIHLLISIIILTIAFSFALTENNLIQIIFNGFNNDGFRYNIIKIFLGILTAFFLHEISHKLMAQKFGLWSEYRMYPKGIGLALLFGFLTPFVFAAPGAVMFRGKVRIFEMGKIAVVGPIANILIATITFFIYLFVSYESIINDTIGFICLINAIIATFNLLPIGPLDGIKIVKWNVNVWIISLITAITITMVIFTRIVL
jgi:Zn-dependent protease